MSAQKDVAKDLSDNSSNDTSDLEVAKFQGSFAPDARPSKTLSSAWYRNRAYLLEGWSDVSIWKAALIEGVAMSGLVYVSGNITATLLSYNTAQLGAYIGISNMILVSVFIYATAATSGGHINQLITFSAIFAGICPVSRGVLYLCAQTLGSALAGGILAGVYGRERSIKFHGGGCFYDPSAISQGQVLLNEIFASFTLLYLAYGVGLDPRQALLFGPRFGPLLVGASLGLVSFASSGIALGYAGAEMNPGRCLAYAIVRRDMSNQWIWWVGPAIAALLMAVLYNFAPPQSAAKSARNTRPILSVEHSNEASLGA